MCIGLRFEMATFNPQGSFVLVRLGRRSVTLLTVDPKAPAGVLWWSGRRGSNPRDQFGRSAIPNGGGQEV